MREYDAGLDSDEVSGDELRYLTEFNIANYKNERAHWPAERLSQGRVAGPSHSAMGTVSRRDWCSADYIE